MNSVEKTPPIPVGNYIDALINNKHCRVLIDTGAHYSCINSDFAKRLCLPIDTSSHLPQLLSATSDPLKVVGHAAVPTSVGGYTFSTDFVVIDNLYHNAIFGLNTLRDNKAVIDIATATFTIADSLVAVPLMHRYAKRNVLRTVQSITLDPCHEIVIPVRISPKYTLGPSLIEPLLKKYSKKCAVAKIFVDPRDRTTVCRLINLSDMPCVIPARTAIATIVNANLVSDDSNMVHNRVDANDMSECDDNTERTHEQKLQVLVDKGFRLTRDNLTSQQFAELVSLLYEYNDAFATNIGDLPGVKGVECEIYLL